RLNPEFVAKTTRSLGTFVGINFAYGVMTPGIDMTAHVGGLIGGFASGVLLLAGKQADAQRIKRAIAVAVGGVAIVAGLLFALMSRTTYYSILNEFDQVDPAAIGKFNALREQRLAEKITDAQLADAIEREVIPPWEALHHRLDEVAVPSEMESLDRKI